MKVRVKFFGSLTELFGGGEREIELASGANVKDLLGLLCPSEKHCQAICDDSGLLKYYVNIMVNNGKDTRLVGEPSSMLENGDNITIFTAVCGG